MTIPFSATIYDNASLGFTFFSSIKNGQNRFRTNDPESDDTFRILFLHGVLPVLHLFSGAGQQFIAVEFQKTILSRCPILHTHRYLAFSL